MAHHSHVPKFGNWDGDNEQYTACFENARREKGETRLTMMNPNDPGQNPEAFNLVMGAGGGGTGGALSHNSNSSLGRSSHRRNVSRQRSRESHGSFTTDSVSERSNYSDHSVLHRRDHKKSMSKGGSSFSSSSHHRRGSGSHSSRDFENQKGTVIPKFGEWDEKDPKSGESFTVIFNKVKQEKQIESHHLHNVPSQLGNYANVQKQCDGPSPKMSKYCCFFSSESK